MGKYPDPNWKPSKSTQLLATFFQQHYLNGAITERERSTKKSKETKKATTPVAEVNPTAKEKRNIPNTTHINVIFTFFKGSYSEAFPLFLNVTYDEERHLVFYSETNEMIWK